MQGADRCQITASCKAISLCWLGLGSLVSLRGAGMGLCLPHRAGGRRRKRRILGVVAFPFLSHLSMWWSLAFLGMAEHLPTGNGELIPRVCLLVYSFYFPRGTGIISTHGFSHFWPPSSLPTSREKGIGLARGAPKSASAALGLVMLLNQSATPLDWGASWGKTTFFFFSPLIRNRSVSPEQGQCKLALYLLQIISEPLRAGLCHSWSPCRAKKPTKLSSSEIL